MVPYAEALDLLLAETPRLADECVAVEAAPGRLLAVDIVSALSLPGFDNAAMDGYAVRAPAEVMPAGTTCLTAAMHAAGDPVESYPGAEACEIATGARMPLGLDTVIPVERCERDGARVRFVAAERRGQNVRTAGSDIPSGATALRAGRRVDPPAVMLLAGIGADTVTVVRRPRVAVIATGSELHPSGPLPPGGIHDSNGPFLAASLASWGVDLVLRHRVPDQGDGFHRAVREARAVGVDLIVTTGAVSAGRFDFVPAALASLGARPLFHKVAMRPGKPLLAARFEHGPLVVALPGNPIAVAVGYRFFIAPVLRAMAGLAAERPSRLPLVESIAMRAGMHHFALGDYVRDDDGRVMARVLPAQAAYRILPYTQADVWLSAPDTLAGTVDVWPLDPAAAP